MNNLKNLVVVISGLFLLSCSSQNSIAKPVKKSDTTAKGNGYSMFTNTIDAPEVRFHKEDDSVSAANMYNYYKNLSK
jgi:hypothetical protein